MRWRTGCEIFGDKEQGAPPRDDTDASIMLPAAAKETSHQVSSKYVSLVSVHSLNIGPSFGKCVPVP